MVGLDSLKIMADKRELVIVPVSGYALFEIKYEGGGVMPAVLRGKYTSDVKAARAIGDYYKSLPVKKTKKVEDNGWACRYTQCRNSRA